RGLDDNRAALDTDSLRGHADPYVTGVHDLVGRAHPFRVRIDATGHVEPLDDDRAAELRVVGRCSHEHARAIAAVRGGCALAAPVAPLGADDAIRRRGPGRRVLALYVSERL